MKRLLIVIGILALFVGGADAQVKFRGFTALNGSGTGAVDKIPIAELTNGDIGFVATPTNFYVFKFDSTSTDAEACADPVCTRIRPDDYATEGVWKLVNLYGAAIVTGPSADPTMTFSDADNAAGTAKIFGNSSGGANDIIMSIGVEDSTGESTVYIEVDGVSETVDILKPIVASSTFTASGGVVLPDAGGMKVTPSATNNKYSGITMDRTAGETLALGDAVYYKSDGKLWKADADAAATMPAIGIIVVGGNAEATVTVLTHGTVTDTDWNFGTVGGYLYVSEDAGAIEDTLSDISDENDVVQILGIALSADTIFVNPSLVTVVLAAP